MSEVTTNYVYRPTVKARKLFAFPLENQPKEIIKLASFLCVELGETYAGTKRANRASLKAATHMVGNYLRAVKRYPESPHHYHFHYSRNEANLREELTGFTPKVISFIDLMAKTGLIHNEVVPPSFLGNGRESSFYFQPFFHTLMQFTINKIWGEGKKEEILKLTTAPSLRPVLICRENLYGHTREQNKKAKPQILNPRSGPKKQISTTLNQSGFIR